MMLSSTKTLIRRLTRSPLFSGSLLLIGIMVNGLVGAVLVFSSNVLHSALPSPSSSRLIALYWRSNQPLPSSILQSSAGYDDHAAFPFRTYQSLAQSCHYCEGVLASTPLGIGKKSELEIQGATFRLVGEAVSPNYFSILGIRSETPSSLRLALTRGEAVPIVIGDKLWSAAFQRDQRAIGALVQLDHVPYQIVGVADRSFTGITQGRDVQFWIPLGSTGVNPEFEPSFWTLNILVLPKDPLDKSAVAEISQIASASLTIPDAPRPAVSVETESGANGFGALRQLMKPFITIVFSVAWLLAAAALASVALLVLVRVIDAHRQISIRLALGASSYRVVLQIVSEAILLIISAAAIGLAIGMPLGRKFCAEMNASLTHIGLSIPSHSVGAWTMIATLFVNVLIASALAVLACLVTMPTAHSIGATLTRAMSLGRVDTRHLWRLTSTLIFAELVLTVMVVNSSFLLLNNARKLLTAPLGFDEQNLFLASVLPAPQTAPSDRSSMLRGFYEDLLQRLGNEFGAENVAASTVTPVTSWDTTLQFSWEGTRPSANTGVAVPVNLVSGGFFHVMSIPLITGRGITPDDIARGSKCAVISQYAARYFYGDTNPVGHQLKFQEYTFEIVGIAGDVLYHGPRGQPEARVYLPYTDFINLAVRLPEALNIEIRTQKSSGEVWNSVRNSVHHVSSSARVGYLRTQAQQVNEDIAEQRIAAAMATAATVVLLGIILIAIYSITAQGVLQRLQEIAVRMAIGAPRGQVAKVVIRRLVLIEAMVLLLVVPATIVSDKLIAHSIYSEAVDALRSIDLVKSASATVLSIVLASIAGALPPLIRAVRTNPIDVLRVQ